MWHGTSDLQLLIQPNTSAIRLLLPRSSLGQHGIAVSRSAVPLAVVSRASTRISSGPRLHISHPETTTVGSVVVADRREKGRSMLMKKIPEIRRQAG